jgi:hypothetical protein
MCRGSCNLPPACPFVDPSPPSVAQTAEAHHTHVLLRSLLLGWSQVTRQRKEQEDAADTAVPEQEEFLLEASSQGYATMVSNALAPAPVPHAALVVPHLARTFG